MRPERAKRVQEVLTEPQKVVLSETEGILWDYSGLRRSATENHRWWFIRCTPTRKGEFRAPSGRRRYAPTIRLASSAVEPVMEAIPGLHPTGQRRKHHAPLFKFAPGEFVGVLIQL